VQVLLLNLGMVASLHTKKTKVSPNYIVAMKGEDSIRFHEQVGFRLARKRERAQLASSLRRPNKGGIPHLGPLLKAVHQRIVATVNKPVALKKVKTINSIFFTYIPTKRNLSRAKLGQLITYCDSSGVACDELKKVHANRHFYDRVETLTPGEAQVYDLSVPEGNSYVANGFVSHNSVFMRQVALLTIMAQMGSFVPAKSARVGLADRVFTRVGASDDLTRAQSTFMVEMTEAANILNNASARSLVILDEVGRGTSTYDGVALAWGITEYLHDTVQCRSLFATHYHELSELAVRLPGLRNYNVLIHEAADEIIFLHRIAPGSSYKSYGVHVAKRAGIPETVLKRAREVLAELEERHARQPAQEGALISKPRLAQSSLFAGTEDPVLVALRACKVESLTPEQVLALVKRWQRELGVKGGP
jgi:DNA mismatch repair protein MutS